MMGKEKQRLKIVLEPFEVLASEEKNWLITCCSTNVIARSLQRSSQVRTDTRPSAKVENIHPLAGARQRAGI
jgi:hypothetical protein